MKTETTYFHCGPQLRETLAKEIGEVESVIAGIRWVETFRYETQVPDPLSQSALAKPPEHQTAYNRAFAEAFGRLGWQSQPVLRTDPTLKGDFRKGLVFVEIQFGNSATLYRDYYKFQYGLANGLLSLAVLIVPVSPKAFFPTRPQSVHNMAEYALAQTYLTVLPINVPTLLIGLLPAD